MCKINVSIDRDMTTLSALPAARAYARDVRNIWTAGDFVRIYNDYMSESNQYSRHVYGDVLKCDIHIFPETWLSDSRFFMGVEIIAFDAIAAYRVRFYVSQDGEIDKRDDVITFEKYTKQ